MQAGYNETNLVAMGSWLIPIESAQNGIRGPLLPFALIKADQVKFPKAAIQWVQAIPICGCQLCGPSGHGSEFAGCPLLAKTSSLKAIR